MAYFQDTIVDNVLKFDDFFVEQEELGQILSKSSLASEKFRTKGNALYIKKSHTEDVHKQILVLYTQSISFAPNNSEDLAKAYSNRSALLMHLQRYEECLVDIDRALEISKSDALRIKLESRKRDCLMLRSDKPVVRVVPEELPNLSPSTKISCASKAVDIKYNDVLGRHLVATRDMRPGEIIIVEKAYTCFPRKSQIHIICSHCMGFAWNGIPCDTCVFAIFCSQECKQAAWEEYHDVECCIIRFMFFDKNAHITNIMVAIRVFIKAVKSEGFENVMKEAQLANEKKIGDIESMLWNGMLDSNKFRSCCNLVNHTEDKKRRGIDENFYEAMIVNLLLRYTSIFPCDMSSDKRLKIADELLTQLVDVFVNLRNLLDVNSFAYQGSFCGCCNINDCRKLCDSTRGSVLAPNCSLINHSCCPNVSRLFIPQRKIVMYTIASIKKGQQLCDSYGPIFTMPKKERQRYLKTFFYFTCECTACKENWPSQINVELYKNPVADAKNMMKVVKEFRKYFPNDKRFSVKTVSKLIDKSQFDKPTLEKVVRFSELIYKYYDSREAFYRSLAFSTYIDKSFFQFYAEKCDIPKSGCKLYNHRDSLKPIF